MPSMMRSVLKLIDTNRSVLSGFSKDARKVLFGISINAIGNGLILPYLFIYLHEQRHINAFLTGLCAAAGGAVSLLSAPVVGTLIDHLGAKKVLYTGMVLNVIGFSYLAFIHNFITALIAIVIEAIGGIAVWPAQTALAVQHITPELREKFFGMQFAVLNLGLGVGGVISSQIISFKSIHSYQSLYLLNALTFIAYGFIVKNIKSEIQHAEKENDQVGWSAVLRDKKFIEFWLIAVLAIFLGYAQLELGFTSFATNMSKVQPSGIAIAFAFNTAIIALVQVPVLNKIKKMTNQKAVSLALLFWALAWGAIALSVPMHSFALFGVIFCQVIFAIGEMIWSPIAPAIVNYLAPAHLRGRYNSMMGITWQIGALFGPLFVGTFINFHLEWVWISLLILGLLLLSFITLKINLEK